MKHGRNFNVRALPFKDVNGKIQLVLPNSMTIEELVKCGIHVQIVPKDQPQQPHQLRADLDEYYGEKPLDEQIALKPEDIPLTGKTQVGKRRMKRKQPPIDPDDYVQGIA
jgi:Zn ribbon nucleic-acid-binding protein